MFQHDYSAPDQPEATAELPTLKGLIGRPLFPHEPGIANEAREARLTGQYLLPVLAELEQFFLALRARVDRVLIDRLANKGGKLYPYGQCLEITLAVQEQLGRPCADGLDAPALAGRAAFLAFVQAGGTVRQVWGDLRGQFFQNAFLIGTLYVDVSNDTVVATKPKVEIVPFAKSQLTPITDYRHFQTVGERYWKGRFFPNHVLPELAPFFPLIHVSPAGLVMLCGASRYMLALCCASAFRDSEQVLAGPPMPPALFSVLARALAGMKLKLAADAGQGRRLALGHCSSYRNKRWHGAQQRIDDMAGRAHQVNRRFTTLLRDHVLAAGASREPPAPIQRARHVFHFTPLDRLRHAKLRWRRPADYGFASHDAVVPLLGQEVRAAALAMPLGLTVAGAGFLPVAIQSIEPDRNAFVSPAGQWLSDFQPAGYAAYPLGFAAAGGQQVLCFDRNSDLVGEDEGEPFFDEQGKLTARTAALLELLSQAQAARAATIKACGALQRHGLVQPWPIRDPVRNRIVDGLYKVDEAALMALPAAALQELRDAGALALAYCLLLSMKHLDKLAAA